MSPGKQWSGQVPILSSQIGILKYDFPLKLAQVLIIKN